MPKGVNATSSDGLSASLSFNRFSAQHHDALAFQRRIGELRCHPIVGQIDGL
jgi:hypothetical protein